MKYIHPYACNINLLVISEKIYTELIPNVRSLATGLKARLSEWYLRYRESSTSLRSFALLEMLMGRKPKLKQTLARPRAGFPTKLNDRVAFDRWFQTILLQTILTDLELHRSTVCIDLIGIDPNRLIQSNRAVSRFHLPHFNYSASLLYLACLSRPLLRANFI